MPIPAIAALASTVAPKILGTVSDAVKPGTLNKDDFLKLLVSQLKNQDPLNPLSNDQFIAQSTAFSSLEALQNIQKGIATLGGAGSAQTLASTAALLGRPVVASTGTFQWSGQPVSLPYSIAAPVGNAAVEVTDASGTTIAQMPLGPRTPGQYTTVFTPPTVLPTGQYKFRIVSMDGGRSTPLSAIGGSVTGITLSNGQPVLQVGSVTINLADVTTIGTPTN
jgi:flagellar basal-body rod modification protein FlgD